MIYGKTCLFQIVSDALAYDFLFALESLLESLWESIHSYLPRLSLCIYLALV